MALQGDALLLLLPLMQLENGLYSLKYNKSQTNSNIQAFHICRNFASLTIIYGIDGVILQQRQ